jgi:hypothetical protein
LTTTPDPQQIVGKCRQDDCDRILVKYTHWDKQDREVRAAWMEAGYYKLESHKACRKHAGNFETGEGHLASRDAGQARARWIAGKYRGLVREGFRDPVGEIVHQTGMSVEYIYRLLRRAGQPFERRNLRRLHIIETVEEVQFFRSMGRGIAEIAEKLNTTEEQLTEDLRRWKIKGYHDLDLEWLDMSFLADAGKLPYAA